MSLNRQVFRISDGGPRFIILLLEQAPGAEPILSDRYQIHRWRYFKDELIEEPQYRSEYIDGEFSDIQAALVKVRELNAEHLAAFRKSRQE